MGAAPLKPTLRELRLFLIPSQIPNLNLGFMLRTSSVEIRLANTFSPNGTNSCDGVLRRGLSGFCQPFCTKLNSKVRRIVRQNINNFAYEFDAPLRAVTFVWNAVQCSFSHHELEHPFKQGSMRCSTALWYHRSGFGESGLCVKLVSDSLQRSHTRF